jgi:hypothetical protein
MPASYLRPAGMYRSPAPRQNTPLQCVYPFRPTVELSISLEIACGVYLCESRRLRRPSRPGR